MTAGIDTPDRRGRTGLDQHGRGLAGNPRVQVRDVEVLSCDWYVLRKTTFDYQHGDGHWSRQQRETYDRGDGATILLYSTRRRAVLLTRQFGQIADAKTIMLLQWAALDGFRPPGNGGRARFSHQGCPAPARRRRSRHAAVRCGRSVLQGRRDRVGQRRRRAADETAQDGGSFRVLAFGEAR